MRIIELKAENVKKLRAVDIVPNGDLVVISGKNAAGKTSVLDAIWFALGGKESWSSTPHPIRQGETNASVVLDLEQYVVTRRWTNKGSYLEVTSKDGAAYKSSQALLDSLVGVLTFDPLAFSRMKPKDQRESLLEVVSIDLDLDEWERQHDELYSARTLVNRRVKELQSALAGFRPVEELQDVPDEEIDAAALVKERDEALAQNVAYEEMLVDLKDDEERLIPHLRNTVLDLEEDLKAAREKLANAEDSHRRLAKQVESWQRKGMPIDMDPINYQIATLQETNARVREKRARVDLERQLAEASEAAAERQAAIERHQQSKAEALNNAAMPITGLSIDADGVTYNGLPFSQLSSAEQLKVSLGIAMAANPKLRVLRITDGSLLDDDNLTAIAEMAQANDYQVWIEKVDSSGKVGIVIEDGEVAAVNPQKEAVDA